ncbi:hypothetical protein F0U62_21770 [Cystobacter fuscus]|uniref:hypothetical protein n=1 Tax=Cystobacter fuscus TaxID=43 RepID=UPI002B2C1DBE|nr:hypothetical protein F0U62_21770 [Cystobacter fuscus]
MERVEFEEWSVAPDSLFPGWDLVEEFMRSALDSGGIEKIVIFERVSSSRYELTYTNDCAGNQGSALVSVVRDALRRSMLLGFVIRGSGELTPLLKSYRRESREVLRMQDVMRELGAEVSGLETILSVDRPLVLVGHDGEPVFTLSFGSSAE